MPAEADGSVHRSASRTATRDAIHASLHRHHAPAEGEGVHLSRAGSLLFVQLRGV